MYRAYTVLSWILLFQLTYRGTATATTTTTVRRTLSSIPPSLAPSDSAMTTDGEWLLLIRLAYRVDRTYRVSMLFRLAYRADIRYRVYTVLSWILLLQLTYRATVFRLAYRVVFRSAY
jgi:hypothetical protein